MKKALLKDSLGEIWRSKQRFLSILAIVAIGIGFFAGVKSTSPDMKETVDSFFKETNLMDLKIMSSIGLTEDDVKAVEETEGIQAAVGSYSKDLMVNLNGTTSVAKVMSDVSDSGNGFNIPQLTEGRMPQKSGECVVEQLQFQEMPVEIGDTITFSTGDDTDLSDTLNRETFTVVGFVTSPQYISYDREKTSLGDGQVDRFIIVPEEDFSLPVFTEIYARIEGSDTLDSFGSEYLTAVEDAMERLETLGDSQGLLRLDEIKEAALDTWKESEAVYLENEAKFNDSIADAQALLDDSRAQLDAGWAEYKNGVYELEEAEEMGRTQLSDARAQLQLAQATVTQAQELLPVLRQLRDESAANNDISQQLDEQIAALEKALSILDPLDPSYSVIQSQIALLKTLKAYSGNATQYLDAAIAATEQTISEGTRQIEEGQAEYDRQYEAFRRQIRSAKETLEASRQQLEDGEEEYKQGQKEFDEQYAAGRAELDKAKDKLDTAREEIETMEPPPWYVFDRNVNPGFSDFEQNADRVDAIAKVFPIFFVLVAMLVCLSAMTRMVEEQRTAMGTLKALGYSNAAISFKFLIYAGIASLLGCIIGLLVGFQLFPRVIFSAYSIMYILPPLNVVFRWDLALISSAVAIVCILAATFFAIRNSLSTCSAQLMRPKAPKSGKKIFLERIPLIWNRLSFNNKVTMRNLFRYKQRMFMTVIGIAGCTALMLAGFGIRDSISSIVTLQFGDLCKYNLVAAADFSADGSREKLETYLAKQEDDIEAFLTVETQTAEVTDGTNTTEVSLLIPSDPASISTFIDLRSRTSDDKYAITDNGAVISEKLAEDYGLSVGSTVAVKLDTFTQLNMTVSAICENYAHNYIYISPSYYEDTLGQTFSPNSVYINLTEEGKAREEEISLDLFKRNDVLSVTSISSLRDTLSDAMGGLDLIVWVLLASAGALAFVVLYNLTTININERTREIATVKVLGFYPKETYSYVFKENILLTLLGSGVGLIFGIYLTKFVIHTAEISNFMFSREIHLLSFILAYVLTVVFSLLVNLVMRRKLQKISMVESLKSIE